MALIIETGVGIPDAESYTSVAEADDYHAKRGNGAWALLALERREQLLRQATDYMTVYAGAWKGSRGSAVQALEWPRLGASANGFPVPADQVPPAVKTACAILALKATASGGLTPDSKPAVKRKKLGPIEVEYQDYSSNTRRYRGVDAALAQYLRGGGNAYCARLERN
jgi:hypothetical protein